MVSHSHSSFKETGLMAWNIQGLNRDTPTNVISEISLVIKDYDISCLVEIPANAQPNLDKVVKCLNTNAEVYKMASFGQTAVIYKRDYKLKKLQCLQFKVLDCKHVHGFYVFQLKNMLFSLSVIHLRSQSLKKGGTHFIPTF